MKSRLFLQLCFPSIICIFFGVIGHYFIMSDYYLYFTALGAVISVIYLLYFNFRLQTFFNSFNAGIRSFSHDNFEYYLKLPYIFELRQLAQSFNLMGIKLHERLLGLKKDSYEKDIILSNMVEGIITVDKHEKIMTINEPACRYFMYSKPDNIVGSAVNEVIRNTSIQQLIRQSLDNNELVEGEFVVRRPKQLYLHSNISPLTGADGECLGVVIVLHDISHSKELENMRRNFVANVSHELKTPVTLIKGFLETLFRGAMDSKAERHEFLQIIQTHANRLDAIIDDLLSLSKFEESKDSISKSTYNVNDVIKKAIIVCKANAEKKNVSLVYQPKENITTQINASLIEQATVNLIDNAIKYSNVNDSVKISLFVTNECFVINILDTGSGIPEKDIPHLFERFYRVDKARSRELGGTGLGLAIVKHISLVHNGKVLVKSEEGKGSQFSIHIPIKKMIVKEEEKCLVH